MDINSNPVLKYTVYLLSVLCSPTSRNLALRRKNYVTNDVSNLNIEHNTVMNSRSSRLPNRNVTVHVTEG